MYDEHQFQIHIFIDKDDLENFQFFVRQITEMYEDMDRPI